jgi:aryl-alcohol dehydrogenase-like predicted oxidoreductase
MGTLVWSPVGQGPAHGPIPEGPADRHPPIRRHAAALQRRGKLDVVEQLIPLAEKAGLPMTHLAMGIRG